MFAEIRFGQPAFFVEPVSASGAGTLLACIEKAAGRLCEDVKLFDVYRGERLGKGRKSLAFSVSFRAPDHTLTEAEITAAMDKILKNAQKNCGAEIRA